MTGRTVALAVLGGLALTAPAHAATVAIDDQGVLRFQAAPGEKNAVGFGPQQVTENDTDVAFVDNGVGVTLTPGTGCTPWNAFGRVVCDDELATSLRVEVGDENDQAHISNDDAGTAATPLPTTIDGGSGLDNVSSQPRAASSVTLLGGPDDDELTNYGSATSLDGGSGRDILTDREDADLHQELVGGTGNDLLFDGPGDDTLLGGDGADEVDTDQTLDGVSSSGDDTVDGGAGNDTFREGPGADDYAGGANDDNFYETTQAKLTAGDTFDGGTGFDMLRYSFPARTRAVAVKLDGIANDGYDADGNGASSASEEGDQAVAVEGAAGGSAADTLIGNTARNLLFGLGGNDRLSGRDGTTLRDTVDCGAGSADRFRKDASDLVIGCENAWR